MGRQPISRSLTNIYPTDIVVSIFPESVITSDMLEELGVGVQRWELRFEPYEGRILMAHENICVLLNAMYKLGKMGVRLNGCSCEQGGPFLEIAALLVQDNKLAAL